MFLLAQMQTGRHVQTLRQLRESEPQLGVDHQRRLLRRLHATIVHTVQFQRLQVVQTLADR